MENPSGTPLTQCYAEPMVASPMTQADLVQEVRRVAPSQASELLRVATEILGLEDGAIASHREEILRICCALAGEGGLVQEMAEEIARELAAR